MKDAIDRGETRFSVGVRRWQPSFTEDLALNCLLLVARNAHGSWQMACQGDASFAEVAEVIVAALGWQDTLAIDHVNPGAVGANELCRRPDAAVMKMTRIRASGLDLQRD